MQALPQNVLVLVLQHVSQAERLNSCALVSTAWAEAAAMATDAVDVDTRDPETVMPWLQHHGSHVTSFVCSNSWHEETAGGADKQVWTALPCSNLVELSLYDWEVQLDTTLQAATGLTYLSLDMYDQEDFVGGGLWSLTALEKLPRLQRFVLSVRHDIGLSDGYQPSDDDELPSCVISGLTSLMWLELRGVLALESLQPFSCLTKLQHLDMRLQLGVADAADAVYSGQQPFKQLQELTYLSLWMEECKLVSTSSSPAFPTGLQELHLLSASVDASAFQGLTGLRVLELWVPVVIEDGAAGVAALLGHIGRMQQLEYLVLDAGHPRERHASVALPGTGGLLCGAIIAANTHLEYLHLNGVKLPRSAWTHLFPPGRRLPQLHKFELCFADPVSGSGLELFDCSALEQLVDCCPAIDCLSFQNLSLFNRDVSLVPLLRLQQLACLECPFVTDGAASVGALARLSSLTSLHMRASGGLTDIGLLQLTELTRLQLLAVDLQDWRHNSLSVMDGRDLTFRASCGRRPDVWHQLLLACAATAECQATLDEQLPGIVQQLQDSGHGTMAFELAREVSRARAREAEIQAALVEAQAGVAQAQAQLQQQVTADRQRLATLPIAWP